MAASSPRCPARPADAGIRSDRGGLRNNDLDAIIVATLFDIDTSALAQVEVQFANAGLLALTGKLLTVTNMWAGFDIYSKVSSGSTMTNHAFAALGVVVGRPASTRSGR